MNRAQSIFKSFLAFLVALAMLVITTFPLYEVVSLGLYGVEAEAVVIEYKPQRCGRVRRQRTCHYHLLSDGVRNFRINLGAEYPKGVALAVVYSPSISSMAMIASERSSLSKFIKDNYNWIYIPPFFASLYFFWLAFQHFRDGLDQKRIPEMPLSEQERTHLRHEEERKKRAAADWGIK